MISVINRSIRAATAGSTIPRRPQIALPLGGVLLAVVAASKLAVEMRTLRHGDDGVIDDVSARPGEFDRWSLAQTAGLLRGRFALLMRCRLTCLVAGGLVLPLVSLVYFSPLFAMSSFVLCFAGEIVERSLFFRAVVPPRMPGGS